MSDHERQRARRKPTVASASREPYGLSDADAIMALVMHLGGSLQRFEKTVRVMVSVPITDLTGDADASLREYDGSPRRVVGKVRGGVSDDAYGIETGTCRSS